MNILDAHELLDDIERDVRTKLHVDLVLHCDPIVTDDAERSALRDRVLSYLTEQDARLSIHDFRVVRGIGTYERDLRSCRAVRSSGKDSGASAGTGAGAQRGRPAVSCGHYSGRRGLQRRAHQAGNEKLVFVNPAICKHRKRTARGSLLVRQ